MWFFARSDFQKEPSTRPQESGGFIHDAHKERKSVRPAIERGLRFVTQIVTCRQNTRRNVRWIADDQIGLPFEFLNRQGSEQIALDDPNPIL